MKNTQRGFMGIVAVIIIAIVIIGGGIYLYSTKKSHIDIPVDVTSNASTSTTLTTTTNSNNASLSDAQFIAAVGGDATKAEVVARGDINQDGFEDAIVQEMSCGASCSFSLSVVLNVNNKSTKLIISKNYYQSFGPAFVGSSAIKSEITNISIKAGIISLKGYGLACTNPNTEEICTNEMWHTLKTVTYKFDGTNIVQINPTPAPYIPPVVVDTQHLSLNEINNNSYPKSSNVATFNNLYFTTYKDGLYQSPKIVCNGANTCPEGEYAFSKIDKVAFNSGKNEAVVIVINAYAPTLADFYNNNKDYTNTNYANYGVKEPEVYVVTKSNGLVKITNPYSLGGGFQIDHNVNELTITDASINGDTITLTGKAKKNDGHGNFSDINPTFTFKFENNTILLQ